MTMITPSYLGETIEYSSLHACRSTLEDPTLIAIGNLWWNRHVQFGVRSVDAILKTSLRARVCAGAGRGGGIGLCASGLCDGAESGGAGRNRCSGGAAQSADEFAAVGAL